MILEKVKNTVSNFSNFYASEFIPSSRQYFEKKMRIAYSKILNEEKVDPVFNNNFNIYQEKNLVLDNKSHILFEHLINCYPYIHNLIKYRQKTGSFSNFISECHLIISSHMIIIRNENKRYYYDSYNKTVDYKHADNIIYNNWIDFYRDIYNVFNLIENNYYLSINHETLIEKETKNKKSKLEDFVVKPLHKIIDGLKEVGFLNEEGKFIYNIKSHNYIHLAIVTAKLEVSKCVIFESGDYKNVNHLFYKKFFDKRFEYDNSTSHRRRVFNNDEDLGNYQKFYESLSFLDNL